MSKTVELKTGASMPLSPKEFVPLMALVISLGALSIDAMLPALPQIGDELGAAHPNDSQLLISLMFLGFAIGQLLYGPLSDAVGRKPAMYLGFWIFLLGSAVSLFASDFSWMLAGRVLQGIGGAAPRIISMALVRDQYEGDAMARVMSLIMGVFVFVPAVAPSVGQAIMIHAHWRGIFVLLIIQALVSWVWLAIRQPETLLPHNRRRLSPTVMWADAQEVYRQRSSLGYALVLGLVFGNFVAFLTTAPQIFRDLFSIVENFPYYFATLAIAIGVASMINSRFVLRFGMYRLTRGALVFLSGSALVFLGVTLRHEGTPPLAFLMVFLLGSFFSIGILMGNLNSLAMQPVGHVAGIGAALIGSVSTFVSLIAGSMIGRAYAGTLTPLAWGFFVLGALALIVAVLTHRSEGSRVRLGGSDEN